MSDRKAYFLVRDGDPNDKISLGEVSYNDALENSLDVLGYSLMYVELGKEEDCFIVDLSGDIPVIVKDKDGFALEFNSNAKAQEWAFDNLDGDFRIVVW